MPVWFIVEGDTMYLLPVRGSDTQWYGNVLTNPKIRVDARGAEAELQAQPITESTAVKSVVEKFRQKYGAADVKKYYSKFDVAVEGKLTLHVRGADKLWALKSSLEIPLARIEGVRADPEVARGWYHGIRMPGTNVPGVITAGTFYHDGKRVFWDVHNTEKTIVIDLHDERYNELVVEVDDPDGAVKLIQNAL